MKIAKGKMSQAIAPFTSLAISTAISLIICLKGQKSLQKFCDGQERLIEESVTDLPTYI